MDIDVAGGTTILPEPLHDGAVDLGAVATEFLLLGIDPYPRKPDAVFEARRQTRRSGGSPVRRAGGAEEGSGDKPS